MKGAYLPGRSLFFLATSVRGYYWVKQVCAHPNKQFAIFDGNGVHLGGADTPAKCRQFVVNHFLDYIQDMTIADGEN